ncbi:hypothetical protein CDAR_197711 [Caerostris darwini]|uniref:Uncharacterized protein n=1 Tax=Caerostris darwini TaxID=1538125 RepID=A0AAV4SD24_9ARAC|nr:hypothetical protein CDAR_197711 [Caerostris darwini]
MRISALLDTISLTQASINLSKICMSIRMTDGYHDNSWGILMLREQIEILIIRIHCLNTRTLHTELCTLVPSFVVKTLHCYAAVSKSPQSRPRYKPSGFWDSGVP